MKAVVDTNILVSDLLNPLGASGEIVRWIALAGLAVLLFGWWYHKRRV